MELNEKIIQIYPELEGKGNPFNPPVLYVLQNDGDGAYIKEWNYEKPEPTQQQLDAIK
jgi:hypothetical protein